MRVAVADIRNDCEFQDNDIVQGHAVIFNFFCRSLRTEGPLLPNDLSRFPSSNGTPKRELLCSCDLRFPEGDLYTPDSGWAAERNPNDLWTGLCGTPAAFAIGVHDVLYWCVSGFRGHRDFGHLLNAKPATTGRSCSVMFPVQNRFPQ